MHEVSAGEFMTKLAPAQQMEVQANLDQGKGMALYRDGGGSAVVAVSFGTRDANIVGLPPKVYGGGELDVFVSPVSTPASMRSPLLDALGGPPQIARPPVSPSQTQNPEVLLAGRSSSHPRGKNGYIDAQRLVPGREQEQPPPQQELSETEAWYAQHLGRR
jgi:hypothetical protein